MSQQAVNLSFRPWNSDPSLQKINVKSKENIMSKLSSLKEVPVNTEYTMSFSVIQAQHSVLLGKVLTVIDASYSNPTQNKAIKNLIKAVFRQQIEHIHGITEPGVEWSPGNDEDYYSVGQVQIL
jgi:hypothetical protein